MQHLRIAMLTLACAAVAASPAGAQEPTAPKAPSIHFVYMGGNDCPPCVNWRRFELPKLESTEVFRRIQFSYVVKAIQSSVPPSFFLPREVKAYKDKLDIASNRIVGSPQTAVLVNGEVFDYYFGTRSAEEVERMLVAIESGSPYPFEACRKRSTQRQCGVKG